MECDALTNSRARFEGDLPNMFLDKAEIVKKEKHILYFKVGTSFVKNVLLIDRDYRNTTHKKHLLQRENTLE